MFWTPWMLDQWPLHSFPTPSIWYSFVWNINAYINNSQSAAFGSYLRGLPAGNSLRSATSPAARFARQTPSTWPSKTPKKTSRPSGKTSASDGLGGRIWGHPVLLNRGRWATFDSRHNLEKCLLLWFFDTGNSAHMFKGCMQSFDLLALKLRPWWAQIVMYRHNFWVFLYIVR